MYYLLSTIFRIGMCINFGFLIVIEQSLSSRLNKIFIDTIQISVGVYIPTYMLKKFEFNKRLKFKILITYMYYIRIPIYINAI